MPPEDRASSPEVYLIVWQYTFPPNITTDLLIEFEQKYGPDGVWAVMFRQSTFYIGSELLALEIPELTYAIIDRWKLQSAYREFLDQHRSAYDTLSAEMKQHFGFCEDLIFQAFSFNQQGDIKWDGFHG